MSLRPFMGAILSRRIAPVCALEHTRKEAPLRGGAVCAAVQTVLTGDS